jgi:hypothetical protein
MGRPLGKYVSSLTRGSGDTDFSSFPDMNVRLSREDLRAFDREENAIALPDGSGYIGTLNVYHELHCIVSAP